MQPAKGCFVSHGSLKNELQRNTCPTEQATVHWEKRDERPILEVLQPWRSHEGQRGILMSAWGNGICASSISPSADKGRCLCGFWVHPTRNWLREEGSSLSEIGVSGCGKKAPHCLKLGWAYTLPKAPSTSFQMVVMHTKHKLVCFKKPCTERRSSSSFYSNCLPNWKENVCEAALLYSKANLLGTEVFTGSLEEELLSAQSHAVPWRLTSLLRGTKAQPWVSFPKQFSSHCVRSVKV